MARTEDVDFLQNYNFHARIVGSPDNTNYFEHGSSNNVSVGTKSEAGFQSITVPEETFEASEYREGVYKYSKKQPGPPTYSDASFMRGITKNSTAFFDWALRTRGGGEYRADIEIVQFQGAGKAPGIGDGVLEPAGRSVICYECMPIRVKTMPDLDATSGEISIAEMDVAVEYTELKAIGKSSSAAGNFSAGGG